MTSSSAQNSPEPRGLLHILASAFSGVLFGWFLSKLKTPIEQSTEPVHPQNSTNDGRTETKPPLPVAVTIESYPPPPVTEEDKTEKKRHRRFQWGNFVASVFTVLITLGILCVTWRYTNFAEGQLNTMNGQLTQLKEEVDIQKRMIRLQNGRANVQINAFSTAAFSTVAFREGGNVGFDVILENDGNQEAFNISICTKIDFRQPLLPPR